MDNDDQKPTENVEAQNQEQLDPKPEPDYGGNEPNTGDGSQSLPAAAPAKSGGFKAWVRQHKKTTIFASLGIVLCVLGAVVGLTDLRFSLFNLFGKTSLELRLVDEKTKLPIPNTKATLAGQTQLADKKGTARFKNIPWGVSVLKLEKLGYATKNTSVRVDSALAKQTLNLHPTGVPLKLSITNKISGAKLAGVKVTFGQADAISDGSGQAILQVPPQSSSKVSVKISADGYNNATVEISVDPKATSAVTLTPAGKIFFLSKRTGTINVMKANLDGTDQEVVVAGTGRENDTDTILLASRDWQYLALKARRDAGDKNGTLYLINTTDGSMTTMDAGNIDIFLIGWSGHTFVYKVNRLDKKAGESKVWAIKSYTAEAKRINLIDEDQAVPGDTELFTDIYIVDKQVVYGAYWVFGGGESHIRMANADGTNKKAIATYNPSQVSGLEAKAYDPEGVYFRVININNTAKVVLAEKGSVQDTNVTAQEFLQKTYPTYLLSPSGSATLWYEPRDGKNAVLVGDDDGHNGKEVVSGDNYAAYGWYSDNYLLLSKNSSELYVIARNATKPPLKITDYHKPDYNFAGYGGGYGGF